MLLRFDKKWYPLYSLFRIDMVIFPNFFFDIRYKAIEYRLFIMKKLIFTLKNIYNRTKWKIIIRKMRLKSHFNKCYFVTKYHSSNALDRIKSVHVFKIPLSPSVDFIQFIKFRGYIPLGYRTDFSCLYVFVEISKNEDSTDDSIVALLIVFFRLSLNWFHMCLIFSSNSRKLYSFSIFKIKFLKKLHRTHFATNEIK